MAPHGEYVRGIPRRFHDPSKFVVHRTIGLSLTNTKPAETIKVYDENGGLAWTK